MSEATTNSEKTVMSRFRPPAVPQVNVRGFWGERTDAVATRSVHILYDRCIEAGMLDQIDVDRIAPGKVVPYDGGLMSAQMFWDSDFGKIIETAAYCLHRQSDADLEAKIDTIVDHYGKLQDQDGYLNSWFQRIEPGLRWTNLRDTHELYSAGHLIEGAVAYFQATGKRKLLDIMCRYVDYIETVFGHGPGKISGYDGHEEIELALVRLSRVTNRKNYLDLAKYFIDQRGQQPHFFDEEARQNGRDPSNFHYGTYEFNQSHVPVREQRQVVGHAVRAMYLYAGMSDVATEYDDKSLEAALEALWTDLTLKKLFITGGLGPSRTNEGFTVDYDLPTMSAYAETCAAVGLVFWSSRMLGLGPDTKYADVMEQALYNGVSAGLSLDGSRFFYENPLASRGDHRRWQWHRCPCCAANVARLTTSVGSYMYGESDEGIAIHMYCESDAELSIGGSTVRIRQATNYPWQGRVKITVLPDVLSQFAIYLRIPGWSKSSSVALNGVTVEQLPDRGYVKIERAWRAGDVIDLDFDISVVKIYPHPAIHETAGRVALQRGPLLYCAEGVDNAVPLNSLKLRTSDEGWRETQLDFVTGGIAIRQDCLAEVGDENDTSLYRMRPPRVRKTTITAIPYFAWANREAGEMAVWLCRADLGEIDKEEIKT